MRVKGNITRLIDKPDSNVKAVASATFGKCYAVHGIKICSGEKGLFISMPSSSYVDANGEKKYRDTFHPITKEGREALIKAVFDAYDAALEQAQNEGIEVQDSPDEDESEDLGDPDLEEPDPAMSM